MVKHSSLSMSMVPKAVLNPSEIEDIRLHEAVSKPQPSLTKLAQSARIHEQ